MVSFNSLSMASTLLGLRQMEAQIYRAMMEAAQATDNPSRTNQPTLQAQAMQTMAGAAAQLQDKSLDIST